MEDQWVPPRGVGPDVGADAFQTLGVCYPVELQRPATLNLREFIIFIFRELNLALIGSCCAGRSVLPWLI
jgi:hypothetical protein